MIKVLEFSIKTIKLILNIITRDTIDLLIS